MTTHRAKDLRLNLDTKRLKGLYQTSPRKHALAMVANWLIIIGTMALCLYFANPFNPFLYLFAIVVIGARMHALAILMHDASHFRFLKNRKLNDIITNVFSMYPLFFSIEKYRDNHLRHHQHLNTDHDPDWMVKLGRNDFTFPKTKREFILIVLSYFTLIKGVKDAFWMLKRFGPGNENKREKPSLKEKMPQIVFNILLLATVTNLGIWLEFALYWLVPYFSTFLMFQYIRSVAEHFGEMEYEHSLNSSRSFHFNAVERFFFAPHNVGYHLEHHLYPGVPFYNLPQLHRLLMESEVYQQEAHVTKGLWSGLMSELSGNKRERLIAE